MRVSVSLLCAASFAHALDAASVTSWSAAVAARGGAAPSLSEGPLRRVQSLSAAPPPPPPPFWPLEWRAELTQLNTTSNSSIAFTSAFSYARQGTRNDFHPTPPLVYAQLQLYREHLAATLAGPAPGNRCDEAYLPGSLEVPDVQDFVFSGEGTFLDRPVWLWERAPVAYATEQTAQQMPVALLNGETHIVTAWGPITIYTNDSWPSETWEKPAACP